MKKQIRDIKVQVVSTDALINLLKIKVPKNQRIQISKECVYEDVFMINTDSQFSEIHNYLLNDKIEKCLTFGGSFDTKTNTGWSIGTSRFVIQMPLSSYLPLAKEIPLIEFIRYNYNPRIISNQKLLLEYINDIYDE